MSLFVHCPSPNPTPECKYHDIMEFISLTVLFQTLQQCQALLLNRAKLSWINKSGVAIPFKQDLKKQNCRTPVRGDICSACSFCPEVASLLHVLPNSLHPHTWLMWVLTVLISSVSSDLKGSVWWVLPGAKWAVSFSKIPCRKHAD